jgi:formylglycine-generating enzyme required for sulfatase activity
VGTACGIALWVSLSAAEPQPRLTVDLGGGVGIEFVLIRPGSFSMGSEKGEEPVHTVTISKPFYLGKYEVTQEQWQALMGVNPSEFKGPKNPVESVSWEDCQAFVEKLNAKAGAGAFRLPTEAEWEYACRAGTSTEFCFGDAKAALGEYGWYKGNSESKTHPVGTRRPNAWGLYDMHGNVREWCQDGYGDYGADAATDPKGREGDTTRVHRGGAWEDDSGDCRAASRHGEAPGFVIDFGCRLVRTVP